jgi:DNA-binding IclR family transcriptional regulator
LTGPIRLLLLGSLVGWDQERAFSAEIAKQHAENATKAEDLLETLEEEGLLVENEILSEYLHTVLRRTWGDRGRAFPPQDR